MTYRYLLPRCGLTKFFFSVELNLLRLAVLEKIVDAHSLAQVSVEELLMTLVGDRIVKLSTLLTVELIQSLDKALIVIHDRVAFVQVERVELMHVLLQHEQNTVLDERGQLLEELRLLEQL